MSSEAVSPSSSAREVPDLELLIEERPGSEGRRFALRLKARDPELDLNYRPVGSIVLRSEPRDFFRQQIAEISRSRPRRDREWATFAEQLRVKGAYLSETVLPVELRSRLSDLRGKARTLLVQSDDPWIPWEFLRIPEDPASDAADGPFLCEAFAMTRWIRGIRQTLFLPLSHIAVVVPRDCGLSQAEGECDDMLSLADGETRRVERIPARVSNLQEAFIRGDHDGWHFTGHGFHRESAPDLSGIWLEDREELTPVHLSGKAKRLGLKRPVVFLNACSSGQSGMSLTEIGGWAPHFLRTGAGACLGALWPIDDVPARAFARVFYTSFIAGAPIAEAVYAARQAIRSDGNPTWLAYTVFSHPLAVCTPLPRGEVQHRSPRGSNGLRSTVSAHPPAPAAQPLRSRRGWTAAAGSALLLLLASTTGRRVELANRPESRDKAAAPAPKNTDPPVEARGGTPAETVQRAETTRPTAVPEPIDAMVEGILFKIAAAPGTPKSALERALRTAAAPLVDMGISGWTLYLEVDAPRITPHTQDGLPWEACRLVARCRATNQGRSLDLGTVTAVNSQVDGTMACEVAAEDLAKPVIYRLVTALKEGTP